MSETPNTNYSKYNMTEEEAQKYAKYLRGKMPTGEGLKYVWKEGDQEFDASWQ